MSASLHASTGASPPRVPGHRVAALFSRFIAAQLYKTSPYDPLTLAAARCCSSSARSPAGFLRAAKVSPLAAMTAE